MNNPVEVSQFTIDSVNFKDHEEALDLFWNYFMPCEPLTRLVGCNIKSGYRIHNLDRLLIQMLKSPSCLIARSEKGDLAGVIFCNVIMRTEHAKLESPSKTEYLHSGWPEDFVYILLLLDELNYYPKELSNKEVNCLLDIFAIVVKPEFRRQGLASQLIDQAVNRAKLLNIPLVTITCTSSFTQRSSVKSMFTMEKMLYYKDWYYDGQKVIKDENIDPVHPVAISYFKLI